MRIQKFTVVLLAGTILAGCGGGASDAPELVAVTGTVLYKDKPVSGADLTFVVEGKPLANGSTNAEGKFIMSTGGRSGAPLGKAKVGIVKRASDGEEKPSMNPADMAKMAQQSKGVIKMPKPEIPLKYGNPDTSKLQADISADATKNVFEYRLAD